MRGKALGLDEAGIEIARDQEARDRAQNAAGRGPDEAPAHAEDKPGRDRQHRARQEEQARRDVQREKEQRRRRRRAERAREIERIERRVVRDDIGRPRDDEREHESAAQKPQAPGAPIGHGTRERRRGGALSASSAGSETSSGRLPRRFSHITPRRSTMLTQSRSNTP